MGIKYVNLVLDEELHRDLKIICAKHALTLRALIIQCLTEMVQKYERGTEK